MEPKMHLRTQKIKKKLCIFLIGFAATIHMLPCKSTAGTITTQTINLKKGWNAIFLEVYPVEPDLDRTFKDTPITQVLSYFPDSTPTQFIQNPNEIDWKKDKWQVWFQPGNPQEYLKSLHALMDHHAYIVFSTSDYTLQIIGTPGIQKRQWQPDTFNLVGFFVDPIAPPTFAQYFAGSQNHQDLIIYALVNGLWKSIDKPDQELISSGTAYWVYCEGGSQYAGPLEIELSGANTYLDFDRTISELTLEISNRSPDPLSFTVTPLPNSQDEATVPLSTVSYTMITIKEYHPFESQTLPISIESGQSEEFILAIRRDAIEGDAAEGLIYISDDMGNRFFVPIKAKK
jgi:hypothetical protein